MHLSLCSYHLFIQFPSASLNICAASCSSRRRRRRQKLGKYLGWCKVFLVRELHQGRPFKVVSTVPQNSKNSKNSKVGSHDIMTIDHHGDHWGHLLKSVWPVYGFSADGSAKAAHYVTTSQISSVSPSFPRASKLKFHSIGHRRASCHGLFPCHCLDTHFLKRAARIDQNHIVTTYPKTQKIKLLSHKVTQCHVALPDCFPLAWCLKPFLGDSSRNARHLADRTADLSLKNGNEKSRTWYGMITKYIKILNKIWQIAARCRQQLWPCKHACRFWICRSVLTCHYTMREHLQCSGWPFATLHCIAAKGWRYTLEKF